MRSPGFVTTLEQRRRLFAIFVVLAAGGCGESAQHAPASEGNGGSAVSSGGASSGGASSGGVSSGASAGEMTGLAGTSAGAGARAGSGGAAGSGFAGMSSGAGGRGGAGGAAGAGVAGASGGAPSAGTSSRGGSAAGGLASGGDGGAAPTAGMGGLPPTEVSCSFEISGSISSEIPTVGLVDWSTDLPGLTAARIEFALDDPDDHELNVGSGGPISTSEPRALLLGMKPDRPYTYRIVATAGDKFCVSDDQKLRTQPDPDAPALTLGEGDGFAGRAVGFIVTCMGPDALILDADGVVVWRSEPSVSCSRALMDWDGESMWTVVGNPGGGTFPVTRVRMDGSEAAEVPGIERSHHDFAALPGGINAFLVWKDGDAKQSSELVERSPDGTLRTVITLDGDTLTTSTSTFHANAVRYYARDDSYTVSDLNVRGIFKVSRQGELVWQLRANCAGAPATSCATAALFGNHGHELLDNGNLLVFSATSAGYSPVNEYSFSQENGWLSATLEWTYQSQFLSQHQGDVERLPNGNTLVTYSVYLTADAVDQEIIQEVTPAGAVVRSVTGPSGGYASFRKTLYGPPE